jgi:protein TonB
MNPMEKYAVSFDDIVFEHRNQEYGAYVLRKRYSKRATIALSIALFIILCAVGGPLLASYLKQRAYQKNLEKITTMEMESIKVERDEIAPPPPPPPPPAVKEVKFVAPKIVDTLTEEEVELATTDELAESANTGPVDTVQEVIEIVEEEEPIVEEVFEQYNIQEKPMYPGGEGELMKYIAEHVKYPVVAQENGIEGTVYIRFVVTKSGKVGETQVMKSADPLLDEEAVRVVRSMPAWSPGKINGNPVNVWFIVPIKFKLE